MPSPPIVYVPGWGCDSDLFTDVIEQLDRLEGGTVAQAVAPLGDARSLGAMVDAVVEQLPERCSLVGASMGGWVAQRVAATVPERIERLVLASTWSAPPPGFTDVLRASNELVDSGAWGEGLRGVLLANFSPALQDGPLPDRMLAMLDRIGPELLNAQADAMIAEPDMTAAHPSIAAPTLVLAADADVFFPVATQRATALSLVAADQVTVGFEVIGGSNHNVTWEQPERFVAAVRRWCLSPDVTALAPSGARQAW